MRTPSLLSSRSPHRLKVVSLACGVVIYLVVNHLLQATRSAQIAVAVQLPPGSPFHVVERHPMVTAIFRGPRQEVEEMDPRAVNPVVVMGAEGPLVSGRHELLLSRADLRNLSRDVQVEFSPDRIEVNLVEVVEKRLRVEPRVEFACAPGFKASVRYPLPQSVQVRGPRHLLDKLSGIPTEFVKEEISSKLQNRIVARMATEIEDGPLKVEVSVIPPTVELVVEVGDEEMEHSLSGIPVALLRQPEDDGEVTLETKQVALVVTGPPRLKDGTVLKDLTPDQFVVYVDVRGLPETDGEPPSRPLLVRSDLLREVRVAVNPKTTKLRVEK